MRVATFILLFVSLVGCSEQAGNQPSGSNQPVIKSDYVAAPKIAVLPYTPVQQATYAVEAECTSYENNYHPSSISVADTLNEINAGPIAIIWGNNYSGMSAVEAELLTQLKSDQDRQQNVIDNLLEMRRILEQEFKISTANIRSPVDGSCHRTNIYIYGTEAIVGDVTPYSGGGAYCHGDATKELPYYRAPHTELIALSTAGSNNFRVIAHEYIHTLQCGVERFNGLGWEWYVESFANFFGNLASDNTVAIDQFHQNTHWAVDAFFTRYGMWPFWVFLSDYIGEEFVADIMQGETLDGETLLEYIRRTAPFDCAADDLTCRNNAMGNLYAEFANSTANYVNYTNRTGIDYRDRAINIYTGLPRSSAQLHKIGDNQYRIPDWLAPQRFAHNIIQLIPDQQSDVITINLKGWEIGTRQSQWRATLVATLDDTTVPPVEAHGEMFVSGTQTVNLAEWETELGQPIKRLELVVAAVPHNWKPDTELSLFTSPQRITELDRYVYELTISGAWPLGHEPYQSAESEGLIGAPHSNGGGFVAATATVDATAYVGPEARVLDNAQVLGSARIEDRAIVSGSAVVQDSAIVSSSAEMIQNTRAQAYATVRDNVLMRDTSRVIDDAKLQGDATIYYDYNLSNQAMTLGTPLIETTGNSTLSGTAISNGHQWLSFGASASIGGPYDAWQVDDQGLFVHYDFSDQFAYRVKDVHIDYDAYYMGLNGQPQSAVPLRADFFILDSSILELNGEGYLALPKGILDQRSYELSFLLDWNNVQSTTQTLLEATTQRGEQLLLQLHPVNTTGFDLVLSFTDRDGVTVETTLQDGILQAGQWMTIALNYDDLTSTMTLKATPYGEVTPIEATMTMPYATRELHYDSLLVQFGSSVGGSNALYGRVDDIKVVR